MTGFCNCCSRERPLGEFWRFDREYKTCNKCRDYQRLWAQRKREERRGEAA